MTRWTRHLITALTVCTLAIGLSACGSDNEADKLGVGAQCSGADDCNDGQSCLGFKGGYCGVADCQAHSDCPDGSVCVFYTDGKNYCFRACADKAECNANRDADNEANCSGNITLIDGSKSSKA